MNGPFRVELAGSDPVAVLGVAQMIERAVPTSTERVVFAARLAQYFYDRHPDETLNGVDLRQTSADCAALAGNPTSPRMTFTDGPF